MIKNRFLYGTVLLVLSLFVFLRAHPMTYLALYAVLLAPLLSLGTVLVLKYQLTVSAALSADFVTKGETVSYTLTFQNRSIFPATAVRVRFGLENIGIDSDEDEAVLSLGPRQSGAVVFHIHTKYRGSYPIDVEALWFTDFLGLLQLRQPPPDTLTLTVAPQIWPIAPLPLNATAGDAARPESYRKEEDYSAVSDLRQYRPTDGYKKIHWKASAKRSELISKNFLEPERQSAVFFIDNSAIQAPPEEALWLEDSMLEALVSAMASANQLGYEISLRAPGYPDTDFTDNFPYLYGCAAALTFGNWGDFDDCLNNCLGGRTDPINFLLIAQKLSARTCWALEALRQNGSRVIFLYCGKLKNDPQIEKLQQAGVHCLDFCEMRKG